MYIYIYVYMYIYIYIHISSVLKSKGAPGLLEEDGRGWGWQGEVSGHTIAVSPSSSEEDSSPVP